MLSNTANDHQDTRRALLHAATEIFAEKGFRAARVRDIAEQAGANLAAINYHFGGKKQLYQAVLKCVAEQKFRRHPLLPEEFVGTPASARLTAIVQAFFGRLFADGDSDPAPRLIMREMADPTESIDFIVEQIIGPQIRQIASVVSELIGEEADRDTIMLATFSVIGQCLYYKFAEPVASRVAPELYDGRHWQRLATHIAEFSIEGLKTVKSYAHHRED